MVANGLSQCGIDVVSPDSDNRTSGGAEFTSMAAGRPHAGGTRPEIYGAVLDGTNRYQETAI